MKKHRILITVILAMSLVFTAMPVFADTASVSLNDINIKVNETVVAVSGESYTLDDKSIVPYSVLYKGTTYLPMRKVGELVGKDIAYDNATKTASINAPTATSAAVAPVATKAVKKPGVKESINCAVNSLNINVDGKTVAKVGESYTLQNGSSVPYSILYKGTTYLPMRKIGELVGKDVGYDKDFAIAELRNKTANYADFKSIPDFSLITNEKPIDTIKTTQGSISYVYDSKKVNSADSEIFVNNLLANGYVFAQNIDLPSLYDGGKADYYHNKTEKLTVAFGKAVKKDTKGDSNYTFILITPML